MKVCKFGGSSLADAARVQHVCDIILADEQRRIVVVSAPGKRHADDLKVTDLLIACAGRRLAGEAHVPEQSQVLMRYRSIASDLRLDPALVESFALQLSERLSADQTHTERFLDGVKALGEAFSAQLVAAALQARGGRAEYVDPGEAGLRMSDHHGDAQVLEASYQQLAGLGARDGIIVFPGFFGYTKSGAVVTFSRGGSDITGAILAAATGADEYENFTDVDHIFVVDPRLVPNVSHAIQELTYREMRELAYTGFAVFHEDAVVPAIRARVPIHVRNTANPEKSGTRIVPAREPRLGSIVGIASADGFACLYVDKYLMNREVGFVRRLLKIIEDEDVSYEHMPSGIDNVSVIIEANGLDAETESRVLQRIQHEMQPDALMVERGHALIMVVGEGMQYTVGLASRATSALSRANVNIEMMNQGASEISMMFGVRSPDLKRAVEALYDEFFKRNGDG